MNLVNLQGEKIKEINLPNQFNENYHPNLIYRAVITLQSNKRQRYGAFELAGKQASAELSRRRRDYKTAYGHGISRAPRKTLWHRGSQFGWVGAVAPGTVGGRRAHPPKAEKIWIKKINKKERRKAIRSALSASINKELVELRNHKLPKLYPIALESKFEDLNKTKDILNVLINIDLKEELERVEERKVRGSKGRSRGRKYKNKIGPLIIVSSKCKLIENGKNLPGIDIVEVRKLNAELLAPGSLAGRLTIFTEKALEILEKEKLFM
ncbi:MAG: 50S ribosomal protein L4 [Nanoarchaeota archaeon]